VAASSTSVTLLPHVASQPIRFLLNHRVVEIDNLAPTTTILNFLRQDASRKGTKEGCAEGDCGACTVVTGELRNDRLELKAVNACMQFLPTLDGKALFTVEDLRANDGKLHPVQQAMRDCHASQCGFCTPGFVMSLWALYLRKIENDTCASADEQVVRQAITGNLCRCTGYRPIIEAGMRMCETPAVDLDRGALTVALKALVRKDVLRYRHKEENFYAPRNLAELTALRKQLSSATLLAGGTDVALWTNKQLRDLGDIIYTGEVTELLKIEENATQLVIGAAVSLSDAQAALRSCYPEMNEMWERFASTPIRNAGTLGGNIANGSPIGDSMPALIALGAEVELASAELSRRMPLEDLYIAYQQKALRADEVVTAVRIPKRTPATRFRIYKLSKRFDSDISAVCGAFAMELQGDRITHCRIAFGGMAATPRRALHAEKALLGAQCNEATIRGAMEAMSSDYAPLSDMRASAEYRIRSARNLLYRFYLETRPVNALAAGELNVFA